MNWRHHNGCACRDFESARGESKLAGPVHFLAVLARWGTGNPGADVDGDGIVGILDFLAVLAAWGPC